MNIKNVLIASSLANLLFIRSWLTSFDRSSNYFNSQMMPPQYYVALLVCVAVTASIFYLCGLIIIRVGKPLLIDLSKWFILFFFLIVINGLRIQLAGRLFWLDFTWLFNSVGQRVVLLVTALMLLAAGGLCYRFSEQCKKTSITLALILSPFMIFTLPVAAIRAVIPETMANFNLKPAAPPINISPPKGPRVLWLIFDELGMRESFSQRPKEISLLAFDRLRSESIFLTDAHSPSKSTLLSFPAYITGRLVDSALPRDEGELLLKFRGNEEYLPWSQQKNIFQDVEDKGFNTALLGGMLHPYGRVIGHTVTYTEVKLPSKQSNGSNQTFTQFCIHHFYNVASTLPKKMLFIRIVEKLTPRQSAEIRRTVVEGIPKTTENIIKFSTDSSYGLVFVHLPVPHYPWIFNVSQNEFIWDTPGDGYAGNLVAADRVLGDVRKRLEKAGVWNDLHVVITSDHWYRDQISDTRVPVIIKLAGEVNPQVFNEEYNTVRLTNLIRKITGVHCTTQEVLKELKSGL